MRFYFVLLFVLNRGLKMCEIRKLQKKIIKIRGCIKRTIKNINTKSATPGRFLALDRYREALRKNQIIHLTITGTYWPANCKDEYSASIIELRQWGLIN